MKRKAAEKTINLTDICNSSWKVTKEYRYTFNSLSELTDYIKNTKKVTTANESHKGSYSFTRTHNFDDAMELLEKGWEEGAQKIEKGLKEVLKNSSNTSTRQRSVYDVVGGNASVPRYLQGVPTSMIRQVRTPVKQPITNIYIDGSFACGTSGQEIIDTCIKTLQQVVNLENAGTRVNLYWRHQIMDRTAEKAYQTLVCLKKSTERLNVLKLAFPAAHPSMLRRIFFAVIERFPIEDVDSSLFRGYGAPARGEKNIDTMNEALN